MLSKRQLLPLRGIGVLLRASVSLVLFGCGLVSFPVNAAEGPSTLSPATALYARVVRTEYSADPARNGSLLVSVTAFNAGIGEEDFYTGDPTQGFHHLSSIADPSFRGGLCCGTLYELLAKLGALPAGTLLWSGSVGQSSAAAPMRLPIFVSKDVGATWSYLSDCAAASAPRQAIGGLWEPDFTTASDGALVCFYSDETQPGHSQMLRQTRSVDGLHWSPSEPTVAVSAPAGRPGMAIVTVVRPGLYLMTFEACGTAACAVYSRTSTDGWHWGDPATLGTKVVDTEGRYFEHTPVNARVPLGGNRYGLVLIGQMLREAGGALSARNGQVLFVNGSADGSGPWRSLSAPVAVPDAYDNYCPNYSSPLLPSPDGTSVLEFASSYAGKLCLMRYATGPLQ